MATQTDADIEKLRSDVAQLRGDIEQIGETLKTIIAARGGAAYEQVRRSTEDLQKEAKEAIDQAAREIEERPFTSTLSAFGIGLVLGMLFSRK